MYEGVVASGSLCTCSWLLMGDRNLTLAEMAACCWQIAAFHDQLLLLLLYMYLAIRHTHTHTKKKIVKAECLSKLGIHPSSNA